MGMLRSGGLRGYGPLFSWKWVQNVAQAIELGKEEKEGGDAVAF